MNDASSAVGRLSAALAGRYRIERELGQGGMASVYLAHDLRHDRRVALKVLKPELAVVLGAERFVVEIKTTAALQHPHILPLFDSGTADGFLFYVMPYIEGETLRTKLDRETQLSIEESIKITTEVADALDYAHRHGVIHRDIKPENILLHEGRPMVADFGIALAVSAAAGGRMTETGLSLGTPHYMSPEQATADKTITARSDIYALACVLYEMLTGQPPHVGGSAQQIIMKIIAEPVPAVTRYRKSVPPNVAAAIAQALEKLPADRFDSAKAFAAALTDRAFTTPTAAIAAGTAGARGPWNRLTMALAAMVAVTTGFGVWGWLRARAGAAGRPVVEFYVDPPDTSLSTGAFALSPDGRRLIAQFEADSGTALYQRLLAERDWRVIPGTEGGIAPFVSLDGAWLGFATPGDRIIRRIPLQGGPPQPIVQYSADLFGATWGPDNTVIYAVTERVGGLPSLYRVSADGGAPQRLTTPAAGEGHFMPHHVRGTDVVLYSALSAAGDLSVFALSLESHRTAALTRGLSPFSDARGHVVYVTTDGAAEVQPFDHRALALRGSARRIAEGIALSFGAIAMYTVSSDGSLVYQQRPARGAELLLVDRAGVVRSRLPVSGGGSGIVHPRFSPSGDRIAYVLTEGRLQQGTVWVYSRAQGTSQRLSFEGEAADPAWSPDGRSIGYSVVGAGVAAWATLVTRPADGTGSARQIIAGNDHLWQMAFGPRPGEVVFRSGNDLFRAIVGRDSVPVPLLTTSAYEEHATLSRDGRWLAYKSNESGQDEVYVRSFPDMGPRTVVSIGGGGAPAWSGDGRELFYLSRRGMMAASMRFEGSRATAVGRTVLFATGPYASAANRNYDVSPDGQRFVMVRGQQARVVWKVNALAGRQ